MDGKFKPGDYVYKKSNPELIYKISTVVPEIQKVDATNSEGHREDLNMSEIEIKNPDDVDGFDKQPFFGLDF